MAGRAVEVVLTQYGDQAPVVTLYRHDPDEIAAEDLPPELADRLASLLAQAVAIVEFSLDLTEELGGCPVNGIRPARNVSAGMVAVIAAWSSYSHMTEVALKFGKRSEVAYVLPFSMDGLMVVASVTMLDDKKAGRRTAATHTTW
jgi:hypothetical protein